MSKGEVERKGLRAVLGAEQQVVYDELRRLEPLGRVLAAEAEARGECAHASGDALLRQLARHIIEAD